MAHAGGELTTWEHVPILDRTRVVGVGLSGVLGFVVLGSAVGGPEWIVSWLIASVLVAFAGVLVVAEYLSAEKTEEAVPHIRFVAQLVLCVGLLAVLYQSRTPGYGFGWVRGVEAAAVFIALVAFCVLAGDPRRYDPFQWLVLGCFAVVAGIFFYHSVPIPETSFRSRHPVWWGVTAGVSLAVLPHYVSREAFLWAVSRLAAVLVVLTLPIYVIGEFSLYGLEFTFHRSYTIPLIDHEVRATRSLLVNRNAFATVVFAGLVGAVAELHRAVDRDRVLVAAAIPGVLLVVNAIGLAIAYGRALWVITPMVLGIYVAYLAFGRRAIPVAVVAGVAYLAIGIAGVHTGRIPLPEGTPTRATKWYPAIAVLSEHVSLLGEGLIAPGQFLGAHSDQYAPGSPHNSYISIFVRTGLVGGIAYVGLVGASLLRGLWGYRDVDVAVFALAVGYAAHQQFEAYTFFQTFSSSILAALAFGMLVYGGRTVRRSQEEQLPETWEGSDEEDEYDAPVSRS